MNHPLNTTIRTAWTTFMLVLALFLLTGCQAQDPEEEPSGSASVTNPDRPPEGAPKLVLVIAADQVRADYLTRFRPLFRGGLERLLAEGVVFADAHHDHANTVTAAGHATLATGAHPKNHGVIGNGWWNRTLDDEVAAVDDEEFSRSPRALLRGTLGDVLKTRYPESKVYGIGGKDRSAMFTSGLKADAAYWYSRSDGTFASSKYYLDDLPEWIENFNERDLLKRYFARPWTPLDPARLGFELSEDDLTTYDIVEVELGWRDPGESHWLGGTSVYPDRNFYSSIYNSPFIDSHVVDLAKALIAGEELGKDEFPDLLAVTLSATDSVGHSWGPNSAELLDTLLNVDRVLGELFEFVDERIGLENVAIAFSSDHGVGTVPELAMKRGEKVRRLDTEIGLCLQSIGSRLNARFGDAQWLRAGFYIDHELARERAVDIGEIASELSQALEQCPGIDKAFTAAQLDSQELADDPLARLVRNSYHSERSPDVMIVTQEGSLLSRSSLASHGTPWRYDSHVPLIFRLPNTEPVTVEETAHTIDLAPTLAPLLGVRLPQADGVDRHPAFPANP